MQCDAAGLGAARRSGRVEMPLQRRNERAPTETWGEDAARVLASASDAKSARRLQAALKALLK